MSTPKSKAHPATCLSEKREAQTPSLSIVIFAFHEEENIHAVLGDLGAWLDVHEPDAEIVFVDDGSRDRTAEEAVNMSFKHTEMLLRMTEGIASLWKNTEKGGQLREQRTP